MNDLDIKASDDSPDWIVWPEICVHSVGTVFSNDEHLFYIYSYPLRDREAQALEAHWETLAIRDMFQLISTDINI